jgi:hypothetical protein
MSLNADFATIAGSLASGDFSLPRGEGQLESLIWYFFNRLRYSTLLKKSFAGCYTLYAYGDVDGRWLFKGMFDAEQADAPTGE